MKIKGEEERDLLYWRQALFRLASWSQEDWARSYKTFKSLHYLRIDSQGRYDNPIWRKVPAQQTT